MLGTRGYLAPEYATEERMTSAVDVYSYGVVLLELLTGVCPSWGADIIEMVCFLYSNIYIELISLRIFFI